MNSLLRLHTLLIFPSSLMCIHIVVRCCLLISRFQQEYTIQSLMYFMQQKYFGKYNIRIIQSSNQKITNTVHLTISFWVYILNRDDKVLTGGEKVQKNGSCLLLFLKRKLSAVLYLLYTQTSLKLPLKRLNLKKLSLFYMEYIRYLSKFNISSC